MASRRGIQIAAGAVAAVGGYYLYSAGGSPRVAEKQFEHDAARLGSKVRSELPGTKNEISTGLSLSGEKIGAQVDNALERAKLEGSKLTDQLSAKYNDAQSQLLSLEKQAEAKWEQAKTDAAAKLSGLQKDAVATYEEKKKDAASTLSSYQKDAEAKWEQARVEAQAKFEDARKETGTKLAQAVDVLDKKVDEGAAKTKGGIWSWFGSK